MLYKMEKKLIDFDNNYKFIFLDDIDIKIKSPVSNYYLKGNDFSINLLINLKWIKWGYFFFFSLSKELNKNSIDINELINNAINKEIIYPYKKNHILLIDNYEVKNENDFNNLIKNFYNMEIFNENTKVHIKLKINLDEYLIISNFLFPALAECIETQIF